MRKQDELLDLIQSLTPSEQRYFKVFSKITGTSKNYLKLFDLLQKTERYDAGAISKKLNISPTRLADEKLYLEEVLLRALRAYDEAGNKEIGVINDMLSVKVLMDRRKYHMA